MDSVVGELTLLPSLTLLPDSRAGTVYEHQNTDREEGPSWQASGPSGKTEGNLSACSGIQSVWPDLSQLLPSPCCLHSCVCVGVGGAQEDEAPGRRTWDGEPICSGRNPGILETFFPETCRHFCGFHGLEERKERSHG